VRVLGPRNHDGTILAERPDEMWGTDATSAGTTKEGHVTIFVAVDHCTAEGVGIHAAKVGNRFEALESIRQGVRERFCVYGPDAARGLKRRHDDGGQYVSDAFKVYNERWLFERHGHCSRAQVRRDLLASSVARVNRSLQAVHETGGGSIGASRDALYLSRPHQPMRRTFHLSIRADR
jgi:hypothetical protein